MHPKKLSAVAALDAEERYGYFVRKVADFGQVWGLFETGWATACDDAGRDAIPFWPEAEFAEACATGDWAQYRPKVIELHDFLEKWLPGMHRDGRLAAVFPTAANRGVFIEPPTVAQAIEAEMEELE